MNRPLVYQTLSSAAIQYATTLGWAVFPVWGIGTDGECLCGGLLTCTPKNRGKHPITEHGHRDATTNPDQIARWWDEYPAANIGLRCDASGLVVVDLDPRNGSEATWAALEATHGPLGSPVWAKTGGGGQHHFFSEPPGGVVVPGKGGAGIDLKHAGYVVLPPSRHASGGAYAWGRDPFIYLDLLGDELPTLPAAFLAGATAPVGEVDGGDFGLNEVKAETRTDLTPEQFADALMTVRNDDRFDERTEWLSIGAAVHHETHGSDEGLALFSKWSAGWTGGEYDDKATKAAWRSFKGKSGRRLKRGAWVIKLAQRDGWVNPASAGQGTTGIGGDVDTGRAFAKRFKDAFRYVHANKLWLRWDGARWAPCGQGEELEAMKDLAADILKEATEAFLTNGTDSAKARYKAAVSLIRDGWRLKAGLEMARSELGIATSPDAFDVDPYLLGVQNGILDLRTGRLLEPTPQHLVSRQAGAPFLENAHCPMWLEFLATVQPDAEIRAFLKRAVGYTICGVVDDEVMFFAHGAGANGKSVFANVVAAMMGGFALTVGAAILIKNKHGSDGEADKLIAEMPGARLVLANETKTSDVWNDAKLKEITSRERISARKNYGHPFSFMPTHTLWIRGNHLPGAHDSGDGFWRRLVPVPFTEQIPEKDRVRDLDRQIIAGELPGVLSWALEGCLEWQRTGLAIPAAIAHKAGAYRADTDILGSWLEDKTQRDPSASVTCRRAYQSFQNYCRDDGLSPPAAKVFKRQLADRGIIEAAGRSDGRKYAGLRLTFEGGDVDDLFG